MRSKKYKVDPPYLGTFWNGKIYNELSFFDKVIIMTNYKNYNYHKKIRTYLFSFSYWQESSIKAHAVTPENKFNKLLKGRQSKQDTVNVFFNCSNISFSDTEMSLLVKGLQFSIPPKKLNFADYFHNFEIFYRIIYICNVNNMSKENLDFVRTKINDADLTSFRNYNVNYLLDDKFEAL